MLTQGPSWAERERQRAARRQERKGVLPLVLLSFPLFLSVDLDNISSDLDNVINAWKVLSLVIVVFLYLNRLMVKKQASAHILPMLTVMGMLLLSTVLHAGSMQRYVIVWGGFFAVCLLVEANIKDRPLQLLLALRILLGAVIFANMMTVLVWPDGLWHARSGEGMWLLGHRNNFGTPVIVAVLVSAAYDFLARQRLTLFTISISIVAFVSVVRTWSASSVVAVVLTIGAVLLVSFRKRGVRGFRPFVLLVIYVIVDIGIVVFQVQERFAELIADVLDRSADLTGRTFIWEIVFGMIQQSPLLGNGVQLTENNGLTVYNLAYVHAHNGELDILMQGGILTFIPHVIMIILVARNASKAYDQRVVQILFIGLLIEMVRSITSLFYSSYSVLLIFLLLNANVLADKADELALLKFGVPPTDFVEASAPFSQRSKR